MFMSTNTLKMSSQELMYTCSCMCQEFQSIVLFWLWTWSFDSSHNHHLYLQIWQTKIITGDNFHPRKETQDEHVDLEQFIGHICLR